MTIPFNKLPWCVTRAAGCGNLDGLCAVSNNACTILETEFASVLLSQLKLGFPSGYLDMTMNVIQTSFHQGYRKAAAQATGDSERQKIIFLTALNCSENSMDYVARYVKGQIKSERIYEVIDFPNYQLKNLKDFCPESFEVEYL